MAAKAAMMIASDYMHGMVLRSTICTLNGKLWTMSFLRNVESIDNLSMTRQLAPEHVEWQLNNMLRRTAFSEPIDIVLRL